jgi:hypothetical protein
MKPVDFSLVFFSPHHRAPWPTGRHPADGTMACFRPDRGEEPWTSDVFLGPVPTRAKSPKGLSFGWGEEQKRCVRPCFEALEATTNFSRPAQGSPTPGSLAWFRKARRGATESPPCLDSFLLRGVGITTTPARLVLSPVSQHAAPLGSIVYLRRTDLPALASTLPWWPL